MDAEETLPDEYREQPPDIESIVSWESEPVELLPEPRLGATDDFKKAVVTFIGQRGALISLHRADPGATGANEIAGVARQLTTWGAAAIIADGSVNNGRAQITGSVCNFTVPGGIPIAYYGVWAGSVAAPGAFQYAKPFNPAVEMLASGTVRITPIHMYGLV